MRHVAPKWRQPPRRSSPKTPAGPSPSLVVSARFAAVPFFGQSVSIHSACPCKLCLPGQRRFHSSLSQQGLAQPRAALRHPRAAARLVPLAAPAAPPWTAAPAVSSCGPSPRRNAFAHAVPRGAPPHLRRSGSRGGRRSPHVRRGRRRAGRLRPALRAAAVRTSRQQITCSSKASPVTGAKPLICRAPSAEPTPPPSYAHRPTANPPPRATEPLSRTPPVFADWVSPPLWRHTGSARPKADLSLRPPRRRGHGRVPRRRRRGCRRRNPADRVDRRGWR